MPCCQISTMSPSIITPDRIRSLRLARASLRVGLCGLIALGLGACGNDEPEGPARLSRAEVITQGDQLCTETQETLGPVFAELFPTGSETPPAAQAAQPMQTAATALREEYGRFSALRPPEDDEAKFDAILEKFDAAVVDVEESAALAAAGDTEGYLQALEAANASDAESRDLMRDYGFKACAGEA